MREAVSNVRTRDRSEAQQQIARAVLPFLEQCQIETRKHLLDQLDIGRRAISDDFEHLIKAEHKTTQDSLRAIQSARRQSDDHARERQQDIVQPLRELEHLRNEAEHLFDRAQRPADVDAGDRAKEN
jgi:hypothetical protein